MSWNKPPVVHYMYKGTSSKRLDLFYVDECLILASKRKNRLRRMFSRRRKEPVRYNIPVYTVTKMNGKLLKITDVNKEEHTIRVCSKSTVKVDEVYLQLVKELVSTSTSVDEVNNSETENVVNHEVEEEIEVTQVKEETENVEITDFEESQNNEKEVEMKDEVVMGINEREEQCNEEVVNSSSTEKEVVKVFEYESVAGKKDEEKEMVEVEEDQEESETADDKKGEQELENEEEGLEMEVAKEVEGLREQDAVNEEKVEESETNDKQELETMLELKEEEFEIENNLEIEQLNIDDRVHEFEDKAEESLNNESEMEMMEEILMMIKHWEEQCNEGVVESITEKEVFEPMVDEKDEEKESTKVEEKLEEYEPEDEIKGEQEYVEVTEHNGINEEREEAEDEDVAAEVDKETVERQDADDELDEEGFEAKDEKEMEAIFDGIEAKSEIEKEMVNKLEEEDELKIDNSVYNVFGERAEESLDNENKMQISAEILVDTNEKEEQYKEEMFVMSKVSEVKLAEVHIMKYEEQEIHDVVAKEEDSDTLDTGGKAVKEVLDKKIEAFKVDMKDEDEEKAEKEMNSSDNHETMEYYTLEGGFGINMPIDYLSIGTDTENRLRNEQQTHSY